MTRMGHCNYYLFCDRLFLSPSLVCVYSVYFLRAVISVFGACVCGGGGVASFF